MKSRFLQSKLLCFNVITLNILLYLCSCWAKSVIRNTSQYIAIFFQISIIITTEINVVVKDCLFKKSLFTILFPCFCFHVDFLKSFQNLIKKKKKKKKITLFFIQKHHKSCPNLLYLVVQQTFHNKVNTSKQGGASVVVHIYLLS